MKKLLRILGYGLLSISIFVVFVIYTAEITNETTIYKCKGEGRYSQLFVDKYEPQFGKMENPYIAEEGFVKIETQTTTSFLLSDSIWHAIWWEKPNESIYLWQNVVSNGNQLQLNDYDGNLEGIFSLISKSFSFVTATTEFEGICVKVEQ